MKQYHLHNEEGAIAISKKEKGEKPKNESVMDSYRQMWEQGQKYAPKQELPEQDLHEIAVPRKEFEKIKKGNTVSVVFDSSMKKGHKMDLLVKSITRSNKYDVDKINMVEKMTLEIELNLHSTVERVETLHLHGVIWQQF